jgi:broad specificity polyphosphatase/5'/3'-nucleotidase SurE
MNNLKLKGFILSLICLFVFNLNAQITQEAPQTDVRKEQRPHKTPEQKAQKVTDKMTEKLGLNEKQQAEVYAVNLQEAQNRKKIREQLQENLQREQMARYKTVLTSEQYAKLEKFQAERKTKAKKGHHGKKGPHAKPDGAAHGKRGGMHHGGKGNPEMKAQKVTDKMTERLGLNEQQKADVLAINMQEAKNRQNIKIKLEQKFRNEQMARFKSILTPEQYGALEKLQAQRQAKRAEHKGKRGKGHHKQEHKN